MQISKQDIKPKLRRELDDGLCQLIADIRSADEAKKVLHELLSETERVAIMKRLGIAVLLNRGLSYDKIKDSLKVSSATIASIQDRMGQTGLLLAIEKAKVNMMADAWADKLSKLFFPFSHKK